MNRTDFDAFLARYLWREGDSDLTADLPVLVRMGEAKLTRDLRVIRRLQAGVVPAISRIIPYPPGYHSLRTLATAQGPWSYVAPHELIARRTAGTDDRVYTLTNDGIVLGSLDPTPAAPVDFELSYYTTLPAYTADETWVQAEYFDLYLYAILVASAPYLREDERVGEWRDYYGETLEAVLADDKHRQYDGAPLRVKRPVAV